ncbi:MAG: GIY-YIG nuclease family protein [Patescibacteria group bacterium]
MVLCQPMYYVYVLENSSGKLYVGFSSNLKRRFKKHNLGYVKSTKPYLPWRIIFYEAYLKSKDAKRRERYLKTAKGRTILKTMLKGYFEEK